MTDNHIKNGTTCRRRFNHAFTFGFSLVTVLPGSDYASAADLRAAIMSTLARLTDDELIENCGLPFDSYEEWEMSHE